MFDQYTALCVSDRFVLWSFCRKSIPGTRQLENISPGDCVQKSLRLLVTCHLGSLSRTKKFFLSQREPSRDGGRDELLTTKTIPLVTVKFFQVTNTQLQTYRLRGKSSSFILCNFKTKLLFFLYTKSVQVNTRFYDLDSLVDVVKYNPENKRNHFFFHTYKSLPNN